MLVVVETGAEPFPETKDTGREFSNAEEVPNWNVAELDRASIVPFSVVPLREIELAGEVVGAASRVMFNE